MIATSDVDRKRDGYMTDARIPALIDDLHTLPAADPTHPRSGDVPFRA